MKTSNPIEPHRIAVHLIHRSGVHYIYRDREDVARLVSGQFIGTDIGKDFLSYRSSYNSPLSITVNYDYILRDEFGETVTAEEIQKINRELWDKEHARLFSSRRLSTGAKRNRHQGSIYRHPKTHHERKWALAWSDEEDVPKVRRKRLPVNIVHAWDDIRKGVQRNWKKQRKTQYKP